MEAAAARQAHRRGRVAGEQDRTLGRARRAWPRSAPRRAAPGVGVARRGEQPARLGQLDHGAEIHHRDACGDLPDHGEVVRDEEIGEAELRCRRQQKIDDLGLDRHVERAERLVADDQARLRRERAGDADALALAAAELARQALRPSPRRARRDPAVPRPGAPAPRRHPGDLQRLADDRTDALAGIEAGIGILEDHLQTPPRRPQRPPAERASARHPANSTRAAGRALQQGQGAAQRGLAATALADDRQRFTGTTARLMPSTARTQSCPRRNPGCGETRPAGRALPEAACRVARVAASPGIASVCFSIMLKPFAIALTAPDPEDRAAHRRSH